MKASEKIQEMTSTDIVIIPKDLELLLIRCCDCGLWHEVSLWIDDNSDIRMRWQRIEGEPEVKGNIPMRVIQ